MSKKPTTSSACEGGQWTSFDKLQGRKKWLWLRSDVDEWGNCWSDRDTTCHGLGCAPSQVFQVVEISLDAIMEEARAGTSNFTTVARWSHDHGAVVEQKIELRNGLREARKHHDGRSGRGKVVAQWSHSHDSVVERTWIGDWMAMAVGRTDNRTEGERSDETP
ncbi:2-5 RNA ligase [Sesbania bispinosa]|nr:2-5 RNA ligase [Sesbania bispinosa]